MKDDIHSSIIRSSYSSFQELRKHIENAPYDRITMCMNKHLLEGGTLDELLQKAKEDNKRLGSNDFLTTGRIATHIEWLKKKQWVIEKNNNGSYRLVGYKGDVDDELRAAHMGHREALDKDVPKDTHRYPPAKKC